MTPTMLAWALADATGLDFIFDPPISASGNLQLQLGLITPTVAVKSISGWLNPRSTSFGVLVPIMGDLGIYARASSSMDAIAVSTVDLRRLPDRGALLFEKAKAKSTQDAMTVTAPAIRRSYQRSASDKTGHWLLR